MAGAKFIEVGNTLKLRENTDPSGRVTKWFRQGLNIVDIMPAHFTLNLTGDNAAFNVYNTGEPIDAFKTRCKAYGLDPKDMARLWLTGESTFQEEVSNEYQTNSIESMINGLMGTAVGSYSNMFRQILTGTGTTQKQAANTANQVDPGAVGSINKSIKEATSYASGVIGKDASNIIGNVSSVLIKNLLQYKYLSVPKTYSGSSYNPALNFNIRLISPYGHPEAIQKFIVEPLTYIMLLAPPTTDDGVTYGNANYVSVRAYGIADIDLGIIENISIRRGGNDVAYNKYRQPLSVDVNLSIKPAAAGFAAVQSNTFKDKQHDALNKVATNIANTEAVKPGDGGRMRSSMTTLGNMLESFKAMPYPDSGISGPPSEDTVQNVKPENKAKASNDSLRKHSTQSASQLDALLKPTSY